MKLKITLTSLCSKDGNAARKIIEALSRQIEKDNISESVIWFKRNTVFLKYDLIRGLRDNHLALFFRSKTDSFFELELGIESNILNILSASCSMNINIVQNFSLVCTPLDKTLPLTLVVSESLWHAAL